MFRRRTILRPATGRFQTPVCTVRPRHATSLGMPTLTEIRVAIDHQCRPATPTRPAALGPLQLDPPSERAVDHEVGAADPPGDRTRQEDDGAGDLLRSPHVAG